MTLIPTNEALRCAYWEPSSFEDSLRAVAQLAADEAIRDVDKWLDTMGFNPPTFGDGTRYHLRKQYPSAFTTPPKEPPVTDKPDAAAKPDEATVRKCIEVMRSCGCTEGEISCVESLLPPPSPPLPTHYVDAETPASEYHKATAYSVDAIKRRHGLLTPEEARDAARIHFGARLGIPPERDPLLAALRLAANGGVA